jgi:large subunit ribosomal protein L21
MAGAGVAEAAKVEAEVLGHGKHDRIRGFVYKPKKHTHRRFGHRQPYTEVRITGINV